MLRACLLIVALAGCVQSGEVACSDGRLCPPGYQCDVANMRCLSPGQLSACADRLDGETCSVAGAPGACRMGACEPLLCGDGIRNLAEACDGTDLGGATCQDAGFYDEAGLTCTEFCTFDVSGCTGTCGDGQLNGFELCDGAPPPGACVDFGFDAGPIACDEQSCGTSFARCARFGWVPQATGLVGAYAFDALSPDDIWVAGESLMAAAVSHFDGSIWTVTELDGPASTTILALAAAGAGDVWIVRSPATGPRIVQRLVGGTWTTVTLPAGTYTDVWAASPSAVYVATGDAGVLAWNGTTWTTLGTLASGVTRLEGTSSTDIWALHTTGDLSHWNGTTWTAMPLDVRVVAIDAIAPGSVWVSGASTTTANAAAIAYWNGTTWSTTVQPLVDPAMVGFPAVAAAAANDVWFAAQTGQAVHFDGTQWSAAAPVVVDPSFGTLIDMRQFPGLTLGISFDGFFYRYRGQAYQRLETGSANTLVDSWSISPTNTILIDSRSNALHFDGFDWQRRTIDTVQPLQLNTSIWADGPNDVYVSGTDGRVFHFDGTSWSTLTTGIARVDRIVGFSPTNVWFFGLSATHYNGSTFTPTTIGSPSFHFADASGPNDVWAIGNASSGTEQTEVWRWNGTAWSSTTVDLDLRQLVVLAPDNAYATTRNRIVHWDGTAWTPEPIVTLENFIDIDASAPDDIFAITAREIVHFDGETWSPMRRPGDVSVQARAMSQIWVGPDHVDIIYSLGLGGHPVRRLQRTKLWQCRATEQVCNDGVDDDCDLAVDALDSDCP